MIRVTNMLDHSRTLLPRLVGWLVGLRNLMLVDPYVLDTIFIQEKQKSISSITGSNYIITQTPIEKTNTQDINLQLLYDRPGLAVSLFYISEHTRGSKSYPSDSILVTRPPKKCEFYCNTMALPK